MYLLCPHQVCPFSLPGVQIHDKGTKRSQSWGLATWGGGNLPSIPTTATQRGRSSKNSVEDSFPEEGIPQQGWQELSYEAGRKGILRRGQRPGGEKCPLDREWGRNVGGEESGEKPKDTMEAGEGKHGGGQPRSQDHSAGPQG